MCVLQPLCEQRTPAGAWRGTAPAPARELRGRELEQVPRS